MKKLSSFADVAIYMLLVSVLMTCPLITAALVSLMVFLVALIFSANAASAFDNVTVAIIVIMAIGLVLNILWFIIVYGIGEDNKRR